MRRRRIIKTIIFLAGFLVILIGIRRILTDPKGTEWAARTGLDNVHKYKDQYDVCFLGTSTVISNICNQELYEKYGIRGISAGEPDQQLYLTKYTLQEVLKFQKPKVVFLDSKAFFYSEEQERQQAVAREDYMIHNALDGIRTISIKRNALKEVKEYNDELLYWNYFSRLYYAHENWKDLSERNFVGYTQEDCINGNIILREAAEGITNTYDASSLDDMVEISPHIKEIVGEMTVVCKKAGTELVLISGYVESTKAKHEAIAALAKEYGLEYIDINEYMPEVKIDFNLDTYDGIHFNLCGAVKWTDFLGDYLTENYTFNDKKTASLQKLFESQSEYFKVQKSALEMKHKLLSAITFTEYLNVLKELKEKDNMILISAYDDATYSLSHTDIELLKRLGLKVDLKDKFRCSYAALINGEEIQEVFDLNDKVELSGKIDDVAYKVVSGGFESMSAASILIDGEEWMPWGVGFNIVVYNLKSHFVISSAYFNTYESENPPQSRRNEPEETAAVYQKAIGVNTWETIE